MKAWKSLSLGQVAELQNSGAWGTDPSGGLHDVPVIRTSDIDAFGRIKKRELPLRCIQGKNRERFLVRRGDILVVKSSGSHTNVVTGKPCYVDDESTGVAFSNFLLRLRVHEDIVLSEFLYWYLWSPEILGQVRRMVSTTTYPNLKVKEYQEFAVPVPPLEEQHRIVERIKECLSRVDEIKRLRAEARQEIEEAFSSLLVEFFDSAWPCKTLGSLAIDIRNGWSGRERKDGSLAKMLRLSAVHSRVIDPVESKEILLNKTDIETFRVTKDDVFVVRGNGSKHLVGRSAIAASTYDTVVFNDLLIRLRFTPDILPRFANYALHLPALRRQIEERAKTAAGIWKINQTHLSELLIPCPKLSDQSAAIERIERATRVCGHLAAGLAEVDIDLLPQTILRKAFAGKL